MIALFSPNDDTRGFRPASSIVDCNGAKMRAHCLGQVTVVKVTGDIDATNVDRFYGYIHRFVGEAPRLVVDLSEVDFLCARAISTLVALDNSCRTAGTRWAIVGNSFVRRLLFLGDSSDALPTAVSERQALKMVAAHDLAAS